MSSSLAGGGECHPNKIAAASPPFIVAALYGAMAAFIMRLRPFADQRDSYFAIAMSIANACLGVVASMSAADWLITPASPVLSTIAIGVMVLFYLQIAVQLGAAARRLVTAGKRDNRRAAGVGATCVLPCPQRRRSGPASRSATTATSIIIFPSSSEQRGTASRSPSAA